MYNIEYHVLSNSDIEKILMYAFFSTMVLWPFFSFLAQRDASPVETNKRTLKKLIPWFIFCAFLSDIILTVYRCIDYPWGVEPQPSQGSEIRELHYMGSNSPLWGWANDYQLPLLSSLAGAILWFCWTIYAFKFKPSNTPWWKKMYKVIAYIIISITILGFRFHQFEDLLGYTLILIVVVSLLWIAHVKSNKQEINTSINTIIEPSQPVKKDVKEDCLSKQNENTSRSVPNMAVVEYVSKSTSVENSKPTEQATREVAPMLYEVITDEVKALETAPVKEQPLQNEVSQNNELDMMYCKHCGKRIESDSTFCKYCGKRL